MDKNITDYLFIEQLKKLWFIEEIWLFGSRARDEHSKRSDIDLAILCPKATHSHWQEVLKILDHADTLLKIDCIRFDQDKINEDLYQNILKERKVIYKKDIQWKESFIILGRAINRLEDVIQHPQINEIDYMRDATIQRFEFTIELFWKVLKKVLSYEKVESTTPRDVISKAYQYELIHGENVWLNMLDDRNNTSHAYKEEESKIIFEHIKTYLPVFMETYKNLEEKYCL